MALRFEGFVGISRRDLRLGRDTVLVARVCEKGKPPVVCGVGESDRVGQGSLDILERSRMQDIPL